MKSTVIASAFLSCLLLVAGAAPSHAAELKVGDKMDLTFTAIGGEHVSMEALRGKIVIVDFWATWCGPCMHEAPHMVELNNKLGSKGLQIIGISLDDDKQALLKTIEKVGFTWPQYFDGMGWSNKFAAQWGINSIPRTFLVGPDGTILWTGHPGMIDGPLADAFKNSPPVLVDPAIVEAANSTLDEIDKDLADHKEVAALKLLGKVPPEASADEKFAARLDDEKKKLADTATQMLADVDTLIDQKQYADAASKLEDLCRSLQGQPIATKAREKLDTLLANPDAKAAIDQAKKEAAAGEALAEAQKLQADKKDELAYKRFKDVVAQFGGTTAAQTAAAAVAEYEKDPDFVKRVSSNADASKAKAALSIADSYRASGDKDKAKGKYQSIIDKYPGTPQADAAKKALDEMEKE